MTDTERVRILLVEDDGEYARLLQVMLGRAGLKFDLKHVARLQDGTDWLERGATDVILLDLTLPDSKGLDTFSRARAAGPDVPIIVITGVDNEVFAIRAVKAGAQDYLVKGQADMHWLARSIRYAIERQRTQAELGRHLNRLNLLRDVDDELTYRLDMVYVLTMALDAAVRLSMASAGLIGLVEDGEVRRLQNINYDPQTLSAQDLLDHGLIGRCVRQRQAVRVCDSDGDPDYRPLHARMRAQMVIPLIAQENLLGFLSLETPQPERFSAETFEFVKVLAGRVAAALDNARLYQQSETQLNELRQLYAQVSALEQTKTNLIRMAAHDLRSPLSNALGYTHLIETVGGDQLGDDLREFLAAVQNSLGRMKLITDDILSLERAEMLQQVTGKPVSLGELVEQAFQECRMQADQRHQKLTLHAPRGETVIRGEAVLLYRAIINLVQNAIKYTPERGRVALRLQRSGSEAVFEVSDTGYGIPDEQQERLFQPFFRARTEETAAIEGSGLGLYLVKGIVERHNGHMFFQSVYGQGSTFGFRMPLAE